MGQYRILLSLFWLLVMSAGVAGSAVVISVLESGATLSATHLQVIFVTAVLLGAIGLVLYRGQRVARLNEHLMRHHTRELSFQERAIDAHSIICVTDPRGKILRINDNFVDVLGYKREDIIGKPQSFIFPNNEHGTYREVFKTVSRGIMWTGEHDMLTCDGVSLRVQITIVPLMDERGRHIKNVSMLTDVSEMRNAEAVRYLTAMMDHLTDEVYIFSADSMKFHYLNEAAVRALGWRHAELEKYTILDTSTSFADENFLERAEPLLRHEVPCVIYQAEHGERPVEINLQLADGPSGQNRFVAVVRDMSERQAVEAKKHELMTIVNHELRTPLTSIRGSLQLINSGAAGELSPTAKPMVEIAMRNSDRMLMVVNDMLDIEKIEGGHMDFSLADGDLSGFVKDAIAMNQSYGDQFGVRFLARGVNEPAVVAFNKDRLMQVMANLMSNAAKFSPEGADVLIRLSELENHWRISVIDRGEGIPQEAHDTIFEKFTQAQRPKNSAVPSTGLGLNIVRTIVERMDGRVSFQSEVGKGTVFHVDLPKQKTEGAEGSRIAAE